VTKRQSNYPSLNSSGFVEALIFALLGLFALVTFLLRSGAGDSFAGLLNPARSKPSPPPRMSPTARPSSVPTPTPVGQLPGTSPTPTPSFGPTATIVPVTQPPAGNGTIVVNAGIKYQTMTGWEATSQAGHDDCVSYSNYRDRLIDMAVNDLGINRMRLEINSGAENPVDNYQKYLNHEITYDQWKPHRYEKINDDGNPSSVNPAGFQFSLLDSSVDKLVVPLRAKLAANGEKLYINLNYVDFGRSSFEHYNNPNEYAEFVLVTHEHLESKYGWVPDAWEVILEPDNTPWTGTHIGQAIVASAGRLRANGYSSKFIGPSTTNMSNAVSFFDAISQVPSAVSFMSELSYHRYAGVSDSSLQAISSRAQQHQLNTSMLEHIGSGYEALHTDLKTGRNSAWQQFTLAYCGTGDDGGSYYSIDESNVNNPTISIGSRTKFLRQYFKFIRAGAVRINAISANDIFDPVAFTNTNGKYVVVVKANTGGSFSISGLPVGMYGIKYTTSSQYNVDLSDVNLTQGGVLSTNIPAQGVITIYGK
jgi:hypothetical protein